MGEYKDVENQLRYFWEKEPVKDEGEVLFTIDYFDESMGVLQDRERPSGIEFAAALMRELLMNMKPSHPMWDKIKHAAFILHLATRSPDFINLYRFFHEMENETALKNMTWRHKSIQMRLLDMVTEQVDNLAILAEIKSEALDNSLDIGEETFDYYSDPIGGLENEEEMRELENENGLEAVSGIRHKLEKTEPITRVDVDQKVNKEREQQGEGEEGVTIKREKNDDEVADKENVFEPKSSEDPGLEETKALTSNDLLVPKLRFSKSIFKKKMKKIKSEKIENGQKRSYYVKKEKKKKMFSCSSCDYTSDYHSQIDQHTFKQHSSLCTQCGHQSNNFKEYQEHAETHPYTCEICKVKFVGIRTLRRHMTIEHQTVNLYTKEKKMVPCHICGKLVGEASLRGHIKNIHSTEVHKCDYCDFTTNRAMKVRVHMKKHLRPAKPCPECGKHVKSLAQHFRLNCSSTVQKERFPCPICEKTFSKKDGMQKHIRHVHDNVKNILCNFCDYKTNSSFNLRLHISKMHTKEELEMECQYCNIKTRGLDYHLKIYHFKEYQLIKQSAGGSPHKVE